jgi:hypothetical protein
MCRGAGSGRRLLLRNSHLGEIITRRPLRCAAFFLAAFSLLCVLSPCAGANSSPMVSPCPPSAAASADSAASEAEVVACVGPQAITGATFKHWLEVQRASQGPGKGSPESREHAAIVQVMDFLISVYWVLGEAKDLHVHVSASRVHHTFDRLRHQQFPRTRDFRRFLRRTKETVADLLLRTELQLLSERIQRRVTAGDHGARARQRALTHYVINFRRKWKAQTYCASHYAVPDCGHVQASV